MSGLRDLADRCEAAASASFVLEQEIGKALGFPGIAPPFTASIDRAALLVPEGMTFSVDEGPAHWIVTGKAKRAGRAQVYRLNPDRDEETGLNSELSEHGFAATPALALCAAALKARAAIILQAEGVA